MDSERTMKAKNGFHEEFINVSLNNPLLFKIIIIFQSVKLMNVSFLRRIAKQVNCPIMSPVAKERPPHLKVKDGF